ncbi:DEAD/DEAH box helicase [Maritalea myrionectae]|uniref:DEAD/DEAH box helicase n=1 Tax=Maritalea myrionectae TaxID=454601 RepID=UPI00041B1861|nr:DEAD/DEAH box helicase [Maritalea myrionectae]
MSEKFSNLGLSQSVVDAVTDAGYTQPTDIQQKAIPHILEKRDIVGIAQTGTGKTASFVLPMLTLLGKGRARARMPRTLILEPTRELAAQVHENFEKYGKNHKLTVALLIGGVSFEEQNKKLDRGADVLIATPGRLLDHFERGRLLMTGVEIFVIDEADRMLDMGFVPDIERVSALLPKRRQTLLFSATMPDEIAKLTSKFLTNPERIEVARQNSTAETITQKAVKVGTKPFEKRAALRDQINAAKELNNAIVFCNRKRDIATLTRSLERHGFNAGALHGDMDQKSRMATLDGFKAGKIKILVASDVAARGLDIPEVSHVYNFDVPTHAEDYVHRIGRTGRAGRSGQAISLVTKADEKYLTAIEKLIEQTIPVETFQQDGGDNAAQEKPKSERPKRTRGGKKQQPAENAEKSAEAPSTESPKSTKTGRKKRSGHDNQDRVPFGQSDQVPAFLLRPVRRAS